MANQAPFPLILLACDGTAPNKAWKHGLLR